MFVTVSKYHGTDNNTGGVFPNLISEVDDKSYLVTVNDAHVFNPHLTNEFIFAKAYGVANPGSRHIAQLNSDSNPFNSLFQNTGTGLTKGVMAIDVYGYASPGFNEVFLASNRSLQFSDNVNWVKSRHTFTFGLNYFRKGEYDWDFIRFATFGEGSYNAGFPRQEFSSSGTDIGSVAGMGLLTWSWACRKSFTSATTSVAATTP